MRDSDDEVVAVAEAGSLYHSLASRVIKFASATSLLRISSFHVQNPAEDDYKKPQL